MKVRLKKEIVTMGVEGISPTHMAGTYVKPEDWNALISEPDVVVIDTRNHYEVDIGTFKGAIDPRIQSFSQLPEWVNAGEVFGSQKMGKSPVSPCFARAVFGARNQLRCCARMGMKTSTTYKVAF
jgi:UPF0176 protein